MIINQDVDRAIKKFAEWASVEGPKRYFTDKNGHYQVKNNSIAGSVPVLKSLRQTWEDSLISLCNHEIEVTEVFETERQRNLSILDRFDKNLTCLLNLKGFEYFNHGASSITIISANKIERVFISRIAINPHYYDKYGFSEDNERSLAPHVLQADKVISERKLQVQVMPFVAVQEDHIPKEFEHFLLELYEDTIFEASITCKDVALLPNGTAIFVDPGSVTYGENYYDTKKELRLDAIKSSIDTVVKRWKNWNVPEVLRPMTDDMKYKQHQFFPKIN